MKIYNVQKFLTMNNTKYEYLLWSATCALVRVSLRMIVSPPVLFAMASPLLKNSKQTSDNSEVNVWSFLTATAYLSRLFADSRSQERIFSQQQQSKHADKFCQPHTQHANIIRTKFLPIKNFIMSQPYENLMLLKFFA